MAIILTMLDKRFDVLRRDQPYPVAYGAKHPVPAVGTCGQASKLFCPGAPGPKGFYPSPPKFAPENKVVLLANAVQCRK